MEKFLQLTKRKIPKIGHFVRCCKLYHNPTWFETLWCFNFEWCYMFVANYTTIQLGLKLKYASFCYLPSFCCKLYHNPTWFETALCFNKDITSISCKLYHNPTWFETYSSLLAKFPKTFVANYTTIQLGLKLLRFCGRTFTFDLLQIIPQSNLV